MNEEKMNEEKISKEQIQTYAYEMNQSSENLIKIKKQEIKDLRERLEKEKKYTLVKKSQKKGLRDENIERINIKLKVVKEFMVKYNRMGKIEKNNMDILGDIYNLIKDDIYIDQGMTLKDAEDEINVDQEMTIKDAEDEMVDESEVSPPGY